LALFCFSSGYISTTSSGCAFDDLFERFSFANQCFKCWANFIDEAAAAYYQSLQFMPSKDRLVLSASTIIQGMREQETRHG
jgi:hypothetical protein